MSETNDAHSGKVALLLQNSPWVNEHGFLGKMDHDNIQYVPNNQTELSASSDLIAEQILQEQQRSGGGRLEEVLIEGHANPGRMAYDNPQTEPMEFIDIGQVLQALAEKDAMPETIIFSGCNTFSHLDDKQVESLSRFAQEHDVNIIGSTSLLATERLGLFAPAGNWIKFDRFGDVGVPIEDRFNQRFTPVAALAQLTANNISEETQLAMYESHGIGDNMAIVNGELTYSENDETLSQDELDAIRAAFKTKGVAFDPDKDGNLSNEAVMVLGDLRDDLELEQPSSPPDRPHGKGPSGRSL